jgi:branched-chain amino acid transport system substrate-binding protein
MKKMLTSLFVVCVAVVMTATLASAETLKVGVQAPITGSYANEGQGIDNGTRLLAKQINAAGGVMGRQIEVFTCDDQGNRHGIRYLCPRAGQSWRQDDHWLLHLNRS